jgi:hypothetical protein
MVESLLEIIMKRIKHCFLFAIMLTFVFTISASGSAADPYEVYLRYYKAIGGLDKLKKNRSLYYEAEITISGLKGTLKEWSDYTSLRWAADLDLKVFRQRTGYNGKTAWIVDTNGKVQIRKDDISAKKRRLRKLMEQHAFLDRDSTYFKLAYKGMEKVGQKNCYVIRISNTVNNDVLSEYFAKETGLKEKTVLKDGDGEEHTLYSDYRPVKGILRAFKRQIDILPSGQKQEISVLKYEADTPLSADIFDPPQKDAADFAFTKGKNAENIPFEFIENHIYLTVNMNGSEGLWVLDSGAEISVIDYDYALSTGLKPEGKLRGQGIGNQVDITFVTIPTYSLPGIRFQPQKIGCIKLKNIFSKFMGFKVAGILGYDFLSRFVTRIDYAAKKLSFYHPGHFIYRGAGKKVDAPLRDNYHSLPLIVDGKYSGLWSIDLGAPGLTFNYPFAKEHNLAALTGIEIISGGAGGTIKEKEVRFSTIELAGFVVSKPRIDFPIHEVEGALSSKEFTGNAGNSLFRHFVLYLDYDNQQVIVEKGADFGRTFPENNSGLALMYNDKGEIEVFYIIPGSAADKAGFRKGDILKSINGIRAAAYPDLVKLRTLFYKESGTTYAARVERQGKTLELRLTLFSLFF